MSWFNNIFSGTPTPEKFSQIVMKYLREQGQTKNMSFDRDRFSIDIFEQTGEVTNSYLLTNLFSDYCKVPSKDRAQVLKQYLTAPPELPKTLGEALPHILVRLQPSSFLSSAISNTTSVEAQSPGRIFPSIEFAQYWTLSIVYDTPEQVLHLSQAPLNTWSTTIDSLVPRAVTNLIALTPEPFQPAGDGVYYSHYHDTHDASRITVMHRILGCRLKGRPIAFIPNRNNLFITGEDDVDGMRKVFELLKAINNDPRPMPVIPLVLNGEQYSDWQVWPIPANHALTNELNELQMLGMRSIYESQSAILQGQYELEKKDIFLASVIVARNSKTGIPMTVCSWTEGVLSSLPTTIFISFVDQAGACTLVPFHDVQSVMGSAMRAQGLIPERYLVETFPTREQLEEIELLAGVI